LRRFIQDGSSQTTHGHQVVQRPVELEIADVLGVRARTGCCRKCRVKARESVEPPSRIFWLSACLTDSRIFKSAGSASSVYRDFQTRPFRFGRPILPGARQTPGEVDHGNATRALIPHPHEQDRKKWTEDEYGKIRVPTMKPLVLNARQEFTPDEYPTLAHCPPPLFPTSWMKISFRTVRYSKWVTETSCTARLRISWV